MIDGLTFKFSSLRGQRTIAGSRLIFMFDVFNGGRVNNQQPYSVVYYLDQGRLNLKTGNGETVVGTAHPESKQTVKLTSGGTWSHGLYIDLSDAAIQQLIEKSENRIFKMGIDIIGAEFPINSQTGFLDRDGYGFYHLQGNVNGAENPDYFQVPIDMWARAIDETKAADYRLNEVVIANLDKPHVKPLIKALKEADALYYEGKYDSLLLKIRGIVEWAGHKTKREDDRYATLKKIDLDRTAIPYLKNFLDFLWDWTSEGLHVSAGDEKGISKQQAKAALDFAYAFVSYISNYDSVGIFVNNTTPP